LDRTLLALSKLRQRLIDRLREREQFLEGADPELKQAVRVGD
jgi:hypothetical protein